MRYALALVGALEEATVAFRYWVRPYDMLADRRRWFWQRRQRCGFSFGLMLPDPTPEDDDD